MNAAEVWEALDVGWKASLDEAWQSWRDGSAGVGAAVVDCNGVVISRARNRRMDPHRHDALAGSRIAHAEMCLLATLPDASRLDDYTLYTTFEPCLMCASAIMFCRIPRVRYAAADPVWDGMHDWFGSFAFTAERTPERERLGGPIGAFAHALHLSWIAHWFPESTTIDLHRDVAPELLAIATELVRSPALRAVIDADGTVTAAIDALWPDLVSLGAP